MLEIADNAVSHLSELFSTEAGSAIRVAVMGSGGNRCGLGLVPDEVKDTDIRIETGGYTLVVDAKLLEYCRKITIDFVEGDGDGCASRSGRGFLLDAEVPIIF